MAALRLPQFPHYPSKIAIPKVMYPVSQEFIKIPINSYPTIPNFASERGRYTAIPKAIPDDGTTTTGENTAGPSAEIQPENPKTEEMTELGVEIKKAMMERQQKEEGGFLSGVAEEVGEIECHTRCLVMIRFEFNPALPRRRLFIQGASFLTFLNTNFLIMPLPSMAEEEDESKDEGLAGALSSLFDPNEKTKSGKLLPKAYLKSARQVVKTLRESLEEDTKDNAKFRRTADAAKESIRDYLNAWRGQNSVVNEESYVMLEKAIRSLAGFYSKAGPSAALPEVVKSEVLSDLTAAEEFL